MTVRPAWEVREGDGADRTAWLQVCLRFPDGACVEALAVVCGDQFSVEDVKARPALSLDDLGLFGEWIEEPLLEAAGRAVAGQEGGRRARPAWPHGDEGRRRVAERYRAAQEQGADPVLAVMGATGHSRRRALRLIAQAREAGYLTPRHAAG